MVQALVVLMADPPVSDCLPDLLDEEIITITPQNDKKYSLMVLLGA